MFNRKIINLKFSDGMADRINLAYEYKNLTANVVSSEDIIILKCATDRAGDRLDAASIIKSTNINWNVLFEESINQMNLIGECQKILNKRLKEGNTIRVTKYKK